MFRALLTFGTLITPSIVRFLFYFGVVVSVIATLLTIATGLAAMGSPYAGALGKLYGIVIIIISPIVTLIGIVLSRIGAELVLIPFMIRDELAWQREHREVRLPAVAE